MYELLQRLDNEEILALAGIIAGILLGGTAILGGIGVAITHVVSNNRRRMQQDEMDATLKMEMIQRGMPADEIAAVLKARSGSSRAVNMNFKGFANSCGKRPEFARQRENA
jgi:hypothetical protein